MTALSTLFPSVGGAVDYTSNIPIFAQFPSNWNTSAHSAGKDYFIPLQVRAEVTIDEVFWLRHATTAGNVYVGICDASGNVLTDCAVDSDTTIGLHAVSTTPVTLSPSTQYYLMFNSSVLNIGKADGGANADGEWPLQVAMAISNGINMDLFTGTNWAANANRIVGARSATRANAAFPDPMTIGSWDYTATIFAIGVIPQ
jgi:hypothetical protein